MQEGNNSKSKNSISTIIIKGEEPVKSVPTNHQQWQAGKSREPSTRKTRQERLGSKYPKQYPLDQTKDNFEEKCPKQNLVTYNLQQQKNKQKQAAKDLDKKSQEMGKTTRKLNDLIKKRQQVYQYAEPGGESDQQSTPVKQVFNNSYMVQINHNNSHNQSQIQQRSVKGLKQEQQLGVRLNNYSPVGQNQKLIKKENSLTQYFQSKLAKNAGNPDQSLELEEQKQAFCPKDLLRGSNNKNQINSSKNLENESTFMVTSNLQNAQKIKSEQPKGLINSKSFNKIPGQGPKQEPYNQMKGAIHNATSKRNESAQSDDQNDGGLLGLQSYKAFKQIRIKNKSFMVNKMQSSQIVPPQSESQNATNKSPFQNQFKQQRYPSFQSLNKRQKELRNQSINSRFINPRPNNNLSKNRDTSADEFNNLNNGGEMLQNKSIQDDPSYEQVSMEILEEDQPTQPAQHKQNQSINDYLLKKGNGNDLVKNNTSYQKQGNTAREHVYQPITKRASQHQKNDGGSNGPSKIQKSLLKKKSGDFPIATTLSQNLSCMNQLLSPQKLRVKNLQATSIQNQESKQDLNNRGATGNKQAIPTESTGGVQNPKKGAQVPHQMQPKNPISLKTNELEIDTSSGANQAAFGAQKARGTTKNSNKSVYSLLKFGLLSPKTPKIEVFRKQHENGSFQNTLADKKLLEVKNQKLKEQKRLQNINNAILPQKKHKSFAVKITSIEEEKYESKAHLQNQIFQMAQTTHKNILQANPFEKTYNQQIMNQQSSNKNFQEN